VLVLSSWYSFKVFVIPGTDGRSEWEMRLFGL